MLSYDSKCRKLEHAIKDDSGDLHLSLIRPVGLHFSLIRPEGLHFSPIQLEEMHISLVGQLHFLFHQLLSGA
jgi:hypothetical protein